MDKTDDEASAGLVASKLTKPSFPFLVKVNFDFLMLVGPIKKKKQCAHQAHYSFSVAIAGFYISQNASFAAITN